jgi:hypothetical protein
VTYLLDTNVVSELRKPRGRADPGVHALARAQRTSDLWLSVITVLEVEMGVGRIERRDERQGVGSAAGLTGTCCRRSRVGCRRSMSPSLAAPLASMCRTHGRSATC